MNRSALEETKGRPGTFDKKCPAQHLLIVQSAMSGHNRVYLVTCLILFSSVALSPRFGELGAEPTQAALKNTLSEETSIPFPWENQWLILVSLSTVTSGGVVIGRTVVYDDTRTARPADVAVLYDVANHLVAIAWFDRFGIQRIGIDSGVVKQTGDLEGVFVFFLRGELL